MTKDSSANIADELFANGGEVGALMRALDWSKTPLGPVEQWPQSLKTSVSICLNSTFPILVWWGRELVKLYNGSYVQLIGSKHPRALGARGREVWPEIWDTIGPMLNGVLDLGKASWSDDLLLLLERHGYAEECYFTFSYSPIRDESGGIGGVFTPVLETTQEVIERRRSRTLRDLANVSGLTAKNAKEACAAAARALSFNPYDLPIAAIYLFDDKRTSATLAANAPLEADAANFPNKIDFKAGAWRSLAAVVRGESCTVDLEPLKLDPLPLAPWGAAPSNAFAIPITQPNAIEPIGFLLAGISVRKRLDEKYRSFYVQVVGQLASLIREAGILERESTLRAESEAERLRIRELFMNAPAAIAILSGPSHRFTLVNQLYLYLVGRGSMQDLIDKSILAAMPELAGQGIVELLDQVYRTGVPFVGNERHIKVDRSGSGQLVDGFFNFVYQPALDAQGHVEGILVLAIDVTEQVLANQEIETREKQFRALADSIPQLAWMANADGFIGWYNQRWYEYTGATPEQMKGSGTEFVHPDFLPRVLARYEQSMKTGEPFDMVFPLRRADGTFRSFLSRALPVRDNAGTIVRWFGTNTDVEGQQRAEAALRQSEKLAAVGRLASSIAHEINNPLEAVTNLIYLARVAAVSPEAKLYLESAEHELERVSQITSQTLRFHKQQSAPTPTDIVELLESILTLYRGKLSREGIRLKLKTALCPPLVCYAGEIRQVVANLISNALDAMPKKGTLSLRVRPATNWRTEETGIRFTVADTGQGMSPETRKHIYEPFYTTKGEFGTGLGLWVSAGIVEKHRGNIRVRSNSRPGESGTVFSVVLPHPGTVAHSSRPLA
jgi:PAS domain S-box-containing protein